MVTIYEAVSNAQHGSDTQGVLEKIAYGLHLREPRASEGSNWNSAKEAFVSWLRGGPVCISQHSHKEYLKAVLNSFAHYYRDDGRTPFEHWMQAQNEIAQSILKDYYHKLEDLKRKLGNSA